MKRYLVEIVLALLLALGVAWVWHKQEPDRPLTATETEHYLSRISAEYPFADNQDKAAMLARFRNFAARDDGRDVYMLNLLRFHGKMASGPAPAGRFGGTPQDANAIYEENSAPLLAKSGAFPIFMGHVDESNVVGGKDAAEDNWSRVLIVHYPSRRHFLNLLTDPAYLKRADFKSYAMHMALVPVKRDMVIPDFRFLAVAGAIILFLLVALVRALRRAMP